MLALTLPETEVKTFMGKLLREETFDTFDVKSVAIDSFARFDIAATEERVSWATVKPHAFSIIKSGQKPSLVKIVLSMNQAEAEQLFTDAKALFINITFENDGVMLTTGAAQKTFSMDKTLERAWDEHALGVLIKNNIRFIEA